MTTTHQRNAIAASLLLFGSAAQADVELSFLVTGTSDTVKQTKALTEAYVAMRPDVSFDLEQRPGGAEGDNIVKTRLATGEMADIFYYNSGSLFQALRPTRTLADLSDLEAQENVLESFKSVVRADDKLYGVPYEPAMGGGIFYNKPLYAELGLSVPTTWDEFMANNAKVKEAGRVAVAQTYGTTWTSQLFVLADFFNVQAEVPDFAERYTANEAKFADTPAAMRGFEYLEQLHAGGYFNEDFGAARYDDGLRMVASGEAAHYPMLTFAIPAIEQNHPELLEDVGFFAQPGPDAASNGLTVWMPGALYIPKSSENVEEAKAFLEFVASAEGCAVVSAAVAVTGPYVIRDCELPEEVPGAVSDMLPYFETEGTTAPALEFLSPVKGPSLEQITVEAGSGMRPGAEAAALYDGDVAKQAKQLGLPNW